MISTLKQEYLLYYCQNCVLMMFPFDRFPKILYKYRDWNNDYHKRLLTDNELYFASANQYNDPFDCAIPYRFREEELTKDNLFKLYLHLVKIKHPDYSDSQLQAEAFKNQQADLIHDEQYQEKMEEEFQDSFNKEFGIVSLTANRNNFLMWSHYAASHTGFCVGFNTDKLCKVTKGDRILEPVMYNETFPIFKLLDDLKDPVKNFKKANYAKSKVWEYENEYRILKMGMARKTLVLSEDTFAEVVLGCKLHQEVKSEVLALIKERFPKVSVYDVKKHSTKFELVVNQIR